VDLIGQAVSVEVDAADVRRIRRASARVSRDERRQGASERVGESGGEAPGRNENRIVNLSQPFALAPMAGMTDTAFRAS
jgi:hypothetical protein